MFIVLNPSAPLEAPHPPAAAWGSPSVATWPAQARRNSAEQLATSCLYASTKDCISSYLITFLSVSTTWLSLCLKASLTSLGYFSAASLYAFSAISFCFRVCFARAVLVTRKCRKGSAKNVSTFTSNKYQPPRFEKRQ